jgi:hypothetical protein
MASIQIYEIKYFHPGYAIGLEDVKNAWLLLPGKQPLKLKTIMHQGNLSYRLPLSGKRVSYRSIKKGLIKKQILIKQSLELLSF